MFFSLLPYLSISLPSIPLCPYTSKSPKKIPTIYDPQFPQYNNTCLYMTIYDHK
jgi:hypothetical protein